MQRINQIIIAMLLCSYSGLYAASDNIKKQDLEIIQQMDSEQQNQQNFLQDQEFFKTKDPAVNAEEKTIEQILNMPSVVDGQVVIEKIMEEQLKEGKQRSLTQQQFAKEFSNGSSAREAPEEPDEKQWTNVMKHSRVGK